MALVDGVSVNASKLDWWKNHCSELPWWYSACRAMLLLERPSSVAAERVFSLLNDCFNERQRSSLEDYISRGFK